MSEQSYSNRPYDPQRDAKAQEPLTPNEVKLVTRLLGDPFSFPMEFKAWLHGWLEEQFPRIGALSGPAPTVSEMDIRAPDGSSVFQVRADGSIHIKTGTSIIADL